MSSEINFDGSRYIPAGQAASEFGFTRDYIALLCRKAIVNGRRIGRNWYVEYPSLQRFVIKRAHHSAERKEQLAAQRVREYHRYAPAKKIGPISSEVPTLKEAGEETLRSAQAFVREATVPIREGGKNVGGVLVTEGMQTMQRASRLAGTSVGAAEAAVRSVASLPVHIPVYSVTPFGEFIHKIIALTLAVGITVGFYSLLDPGATRFATASLSSGTRSVLLGLKLSALPRAYSRANEQLAAAAEDPSGAFTTILSTTREHTETVARATNQRVNASLGNLALPSFGAAETRAEIVVRAVPHAEAAPSATSTPEELCLGTSDGGVFCANGDDLARIFDAAATMNSENQGNQGE